MLTRGRTLGGKNTSQGEIDCFLAQIYHEAPDDVFELIILACSNVEDDDDWKPGNFNALRLANKRCKQVIESCTTRLVYLVGDGPESLPIPIIQRCGRMDEIRCWSHNLRSLEGCPEELVTLVIGEAPHLSDLSPLASCSEPQYNNIFHC